MKYKKILIIVGVAIASAYLFFTFGLSRIKEFKGSISAKNIQVNCDGRENICITKNGKVVSEKKPQSSLDPRSSCKTDLECSKLYSANVRDAVKIIRDYTGIQDLNLTPIVKDGVPIYITYYCSPSNRCWGIDHRTHKIVIN
jgi:hypothetical protein